MIRVVTALSLCLLLARCSDETTTGNRFASLPTSIGKTDQVALFTTSQLVKDKVMSLFEQDYPILPQIEPLFNVIERDPRQITNSLLRKVSVMILVHSMDKEGPLKQIIND